MNHDQAMLNGCSRYVRVVACSHGIQGLQREAQRLVRKLRAAREACGHEHRVLEEALYIEESVDVRIAHLVACNDLPGIGHEVDRLLERILRGQRLVDPRTKAALILHTSSEHWERWPHYQAKLDYFTVGYRYAA